MFVQQLVTGVQATTRRHAFLRIKRVVLSDTQLPTKPQGIVGQRIYL